MIRKAVKRAAVMTAGAGLVLAPMSLVGPQLTLVACTDGYEDPVTTTTDAYVGDNNGESAPVGRYGSPNRVYVDVDGTDGEQVPSGEVEIYVNDELYETLQNDKDVVSTNLRRNLKARATYEITAEYNSECPHDDSSDTTYYTVQPAGSSPKSTKAAQQGSSRRAQFFVTVDGSEGLHPQGGKVKFTAHRQGKRKAVRSKTVDMRDGSAGVTFSKLKKGKYTLRTRFLGNNNFDPSRTRSSFRIG